jgi:hypothetical protein
VEIVSPNEGDGIAWDEKLARYHQLGVRELVRFDPEAPEGQRLRVWDRVNGDLVERRRDGDDHSRRITLGLVWTVRAILGPNGAGELTGLRLVDSEGRLLEMPEEAEGRARAEAETRAQAAEARARELEEQLRRATGGG